MEIYIRKRSSAPSLILIAVIFVGVAVGLAACYAIFVGLGEPAVTSQVAGTPPAGTTPVAPTPGPVASAPPAPTGPPSVAEVPKQGPAPRVTTDAHSELEALEETWPARHLFVAISGTKLDGATRDMLAELKPGGVVLSSDNIGNKIQTIALIKSIKDAVGLGKGIDSLPLIAVAQEGGAGNLLKLPNAPNAAAIGARRDLEYARAIGLDFAKSCEDRGIGVLLAPVLDVYTKAAPENLRDRSFGDNYNLVNAMGLAFAQGVTQGRVLPVAKHYPGLGAADGDGNGVVAVLPKTVPVAEVVFPFYQAATHEVPGIVVAHVAVPELDDEDPQRPASLSPKLVHGQLREFWKYNGVVLADDLSKPAIAKGHSVGEAAVLALGAGCDAAMILQPGPDQIRAVAKAIDAAAKEGVLDRHQLSESKKRLDGWQLWLRRPVPGLKGSIPELPPVQVAKTEAGPEATAPAASGAQQIHVVARGDTLYKISKTYNVSVNDIQTWNHLKGTSLSVGQKLVVSPGAPQAPPAVTDVPSAPEAPAAPTPAPPAETPASAGPAPAPPAPESAQPPAEVPEEVPEAPPSAPPQEASARGVPPPNTKPITYKVKPGDILASIADAYKVTYRDIMAWNNMTKTNIYAGQELVLYVRGETVAPGGESAPEATAAEPAPTEQKYTVQSGDFLGKIADKYGVTVRELMEWNDLKGIALQVGQELIIKKE